MIHLLIGYQIDEFIHTWLAECFFNQSHSYSGFKYKVPIFTSFAQVPRYQDYSSLDQAVEAFEHALDFILMGSTETPELDASFDETGDVPPSVHSGYQHLVNTFLIVVDYSLLLASNFVSYSKRQGHYIHLYQRQL